MEIDGEALLGRVLRTLGSRDRQAVAALVTHDVGRVGQQRAVRADAGASQREELVALGELVEVQQDLLVRQRGLVRAGVLTDAVPAGLLDEVRA